MQLFKKQSGIIYEKHLKGEQQMKKITVAAIIIALMASLCGCSETNLNSDSPLSESESSENSTPEIITVSSANPMVITDNEITGEIRIEKGGVLTLNGDIELRGDLYVEGKLEVTENAIIFGDGVIHVVNSFDDIDCKGAVKVKIDAPEPVEIDGVTYVGGILLVNKEYGLPRDFGEDIGDIRPELKNAIEQMRADTGFGMTLRESSGYRSYTTQEWWFNYYCETDGYDNAVTYSALPGHSEHQSGYAADITRAELDYADTPEGKWLAANCWKYGCIIRYPADKVDITGYIYEPWHIRYLGKSTAKLVHDSGLCLEEFLEVV